MLERLFHWLFGYVEFTVRGGAPRLFTMAAKNGLLLWDFAWEEETARARIKAREYRRLPPLCRRSGASARLEKKRGLPFFAARLARRKGLLAGAVLGAALFWYLSGFVWGVTVTGTETVTRRQVRDAAAQYGVSVGSPRAELKPRQAAHGILAQIGRLSWASVNTDGCFVEVAVKEGEPAPEAETQEKWSNLVASRGGVVVSAQAERGRLEVQPGDVVEQGQLLVSGLYQYVPDPYRAQPTHPAQIVGPARGSVIAETYREFTARVGSTQARQVPAGEREERTFLRLFGLRLPLGLWGRPAGEFRFSQSVSAWEALGVQLPVALERERYDPVETRSVPLSREEQRDAALRALRQLQREELPQGAEILEEELRFTYTVEDCTVTARCRCWEEIGQIQEILVE